MPPYCTDVLYTFVAVYCFAHRLLLPLKNDAAIVLPIIRIVEGTAQLLRLSACLTHATAAAAVIGVRCCAMQSSGLLERVTSGNLTLLPGLPRILSGIYFLVSKTARVPVRSTNFGRARNIGPKRTTANSSERHSSSARSHKHDWTRLLFCGVATKNRKRLLAKPSISTT